MSDGRKYYCFCGSNCKYETMTREQILAAIAEATGHTVSDVDAAFITKILESNKNAATTFWVGTEAEYNAISPVPKCTPFIARIDESGKVYICKDDSLLESILLRKQNKLDWCTDEDIDAMIAGTYVGSEDEEPLGSAEGVYF